MNNVKSFTSSNFLLMLGAAAVLLVGSLLFVTSGAHADTASSTPPVISSVISTPSNTGATITWLTDQPSNTQVLYGTSTKYNASTTLDNTDVTSHTAFLGGLLPNTMYHFELLSSNATGTQATSSDMTFMTASSTATTTSTITAAPVFSLVNVSPTNTGATITWSTDIPASSQVFFGTTLNYGSMSTLDNTQVTSHSVTLTGLTPATLYDFQVWSTGSSNNTASSTNFTFMTASSSSTGTSTSGMTIDELQAEITTLQAQVASLENAIAGMGGTIGSTTGTTGGAGMIDQSGMTITKGGTVDFSGRNFGHEENVTVMLNGNTLVTAHADGGGNFSTGSIPGPAKAGTYTYQFRGATSGITGSATVTAQ